MKSVFFCSLIVVVLSVITKDVVSSEGKGICNQKDRIDLKTNDIFDLDDSDTIFLHRWANSLHIKTKDRTIYNEMAFFLNKCEVEQADLDELERHLRSKKYIRDARVSFKSKTKRIEVETWDNWSLLPTADFGRQGGMNKFAIGLKDRNLLGLGINAEIESYNNDQRSGYAIKTHFPLFFDNNITAAIRLTSNDDGTSQSISIKKPFVSFDTQNAFSFGFDNFKQTDTQYKLGEVFNRYSHEQKASSVSWEWLDSDTNESTLRYGFGFTNEQHEFYDINVIDGTSKPPLNREFSYPFIRVQFLQKDFKKLKNINLINHIEDFNLGWQFSASIGTDIGKTDTSPELIWRSNVSKGMEVQGESYWLFNASLSGEYYRRFQENNRVVLNLENQYLHRINEHWAAYFKNSNQISNNQFKDDPVVLGGESGVRGFPLQYIHGKHTTQFTFEARYYPHINIYKLLEVGGAAFIDTGRVFESTDNSLYSDDWMTSIGIGARLYSSHTSEARVIHVDIIKPMTSDKNVKGIEFRITTSQSF